MQRHAPPTVSAARRRLARGSRPFVRTGHPSLCVLYGPRHMEKGVTPDVVLRGVTKRFGICRGRRHRPRGASGRVPRAARPVGLRQDDDAADDRRLRRADAGEIEIGGRSAVGVPPNKRDVNTVFQEYALFPHMTVLDNVAYGLKQRKVGKDERYRQANEALELVRPDRPRAGQAGAALGRHAAARRARARARDEPEGAAARRAARRARPEAPQGDAGRAQAHPARRRHHVHRGHARPGGGDGDGRPHRRHERRPDRPARRALRRSTTAPPRRSWPTSSAT